MAFAVRRVTNGGCAAIFKPAAAYHDAMTAEEAANTLQRQLHPYANAGLAVDVVDGAWWFLHAGTPSFSGEWPLNAAPSDAEIAFMRSALAAADALTRTALAALQALGHAPAATADMVFRPGKRVELLFDLAHADHPNLKACVSFGDGHVTDVDVFDADELSWWDSTHQVWVTK